MFVLTLELYVVVSLQSIIGVKWKTNLEVNQVEMNTVRAVRLGRGITQTKLARLVEVPESQLCAVERGRLHPWPKLRRRLAEELEVPERELFPESAETAGK